MCVRLSVGDVWMRRSLNSTAQHRATTSRITRGRARAQLFLLITDRATARQQSTTPAHTAPPVGISCEAIGAAPNRQALLAVASSMVSSVQKNARLQREADIANGLEPKPKGRPPADFPYWDKVDGKWRTKKGGEAAPQLLQLTRREKKTASQKMRRVHDRRARQPVDSADKESDDECEDQSSLAPSLAMMLHAILLFAMPLLAPIARRAAARVSN